MFQDLKKYKLDYCFLAGITAIYTVLFVFKRLDPKYLLWLTSAYGISYILWGVWHHHRQSHLTIAIVLEYFLVVILGLVIVSTLLL